MTSNEILNVLIKVFTTRETIITVVGVLIFMNFCVYVANYVKKPKKKKKKTTSAKTAPNASGKTDAKKQGENENGEEKTENASSDEKPAQIPSKPKK